MRTPSGVAASTEGSQDVVRPYEPDDEDAVRDLAERHRTDGRAWFEWYRTNPYLDHVPIAIVEQPAGANEDTDGEPEIVAALPFAAVRVRAGEDDAVATSPQELWTARTVDDEEVDPVRQRAIAGARDYYAAATVNDRPPADVDVVTAPAVDASATATFETTPAFFFTHDASDEADADEAPEDDTNDGEGNDEAGTDDATIDDESHGFWEPRSTRESFHRIQDHGALLGQRLGPIGRILGTPIGAVARRVRTWRDGRVDVDTDPYVVNRHREVPSATLAACYRSNRPASAHVAFDESFYRWWFARPDRGTLTTYVVHRHSDVAAGIVVERGGGSADGAGGAAGGIDAATIEHVVPVTGDPDRPDAVAVGFERLLDEHGDADEIRTANPLFPDGVCDAYGLEAGDAFPTSLFVTADERRLGTRPVVASERTVGDRPFGEADPFLRTLTGEEPDNADRSTGT